MRLNATRGLAAALTAAALTLPAIAADKAAPAQPDRELGPSAKPSISCYAEASAGKNITSTEVSDAGFGGPVTFAADGMQAGLGGGCDLRLLAENGLGLIVGGLARYDRLDVSTGLGDSKIGAEKMWTLAMRAGIKLNPGVLGYGLVGRSGVGLSYPDLKIDPQGWMYGAGLEMTIATMPVALFAEWNHITFDKITDSGSTLRPDADVFRVGARYYFGGK